MRRFGAAVGLVLFAAGVHAAVLQRVEVVGGDEPAVHLFLSEPTRLPGPQALGGSGDARRRVYLDLPAARAPGVPAVVAGAGPVLRVRIGQFDARTLRVVLDLADAVPFKIGADGNTITVTLATAPPARADRHEERPPESARGMPPPARPKPDAAVAVGPPLGTGPTAAPEPPPPAGDAAASPPGARDAAAPPENPAREPAPAPSHGDVEVGTTTPSPAEEHRTPEEETIVDGGAIASSAAGPAVASHVPPAAAAEPPEPAHADAGPPAAPEPEVTATAPPSRADDDEIASAPPEPEGALPTPVPPPVAVAPGSPPLIVIDPGHGGHDPGAAGIGGIVEKDVVLAIARQLATKLTMRLPVSVLMTRSDDSFIPIDRRLAAAPAGAALFLSLHANACETPAARGLEVFYGGGDVRSASAAGTSRLAALLGQSLGRALGASVGGVRGEARPGTYAVLARNTVPGALVEIGYLTHPGDAARACDASYQDMLTDALVDGVARFLRDSAPRL